MNTKFARLTQHLAPEKLSAPICGVYMITQISTGRCYIGKSVDVMGRWYQHTRRKNAGIGEAIKQFGLSDFSFRLLTEAPRDQLLHIEGFFIDLFEAMEPVGFNLQSRSSEGRQGPMAASSLAKRAVTAGETYRLRRIRNARLGVLHHWLRRRLYQVSKCVHVERLTAEIRLEYTLLVDTVP